jgi:hypothetical protein
MKSFIKVVEDSEATLANGSNEYFFQGEGYAPLSDNLAKVVRNWCQRNLSTKELKSDGTKGEDALEIYVIPIDKKTKKHELQSFLQEISKAFIKTLTLVKEEITQENIMNSKANTQFDALEEMVHLRTLLLKVATKRYPSPKSAVFINV